MKVAFGIFCDKYFICHDKTIYTPKFDMSIVDENKITIIIKKENCYYYSEIIAIYNMLCD